MSHLSANINLKNTGDSHMAEVEDKVNVSDNSLMVAITRA